MNKKFIVHAICFFGALNSIAYYIQSTNPLGHEQQEIAQIVWQEKDTRHKESSRSKWRRSQEGQPLFQKDLVYAGRDSWAEIKLRSGLRVTLAAESVAQVGVETNPDILNFGSGFFNLKVNDSVLFLVRGKLFEVKANQASFLVYNSPSEEVYFKVVRGSLEYKQSHLQQSVAMVEGEIVYPFRAKTEDSPKNMQLSGNKNLEPLSEAEIETAKVEAKSESKVQVAEVLPKKSWVPIRHRNMAKSSKFQLQASVSKDSEVTAKFTSPKRIVANAETKPPNPSPDLQSVAITDEVEAPVLLQANENTASDFVSPPERPDPDSVVEATSPLEKNFWMWFGSGVNFSSHSQEVPGFSSLQFGAIHGPSMMFKSGFFASDYLGLELGFLAVPGMAKSSPAVEIQEGSYSWQTLNADLIVRTNTESTRDSQWRWRVGVHQHQVPFLVPLSANNIRLMDSSMTHAALGFEYRRLFKNRVRFEWLSRYQIPLGSATTSNTLLKRDAAVSFDGSIGAVYQVTSHFYLGTYWYGQYHNFSFDYDDTVGTKFSGMQSLLFSNVDLRLGWEF